MSDGLTHVIYTSAATPNLDPSEILSVVQSARQKNADRSITGMLLYVAGTFFQVLEGEESTVLALFATISSDPRHDRVTKIIQEPIAKRAFADWTMGFSELHPSELESADELKGFFHGGRSLANVEPGRAKMLIEAFAQGRWRARLK